MTAKPRTRYKQKTGYKEIGRYKYYDSLTFEPFYVPYNAFYEEWQHMSDFTHPGPPYLEGSKFDSIKLKTDRNAFGAMPVNLKGNGGTLNHGPREYNGIFVHKSFPHLDGFPPFPKKNPTTNIGHVGWMIPTDALLETLGATAWARFKPGKPLSSSDQAVLEAVKDGIPTIPGTKLLSALVARKKNLLQNLLRASGQEYLNIEFGWKPILRDLQGLYKAQRLLERRLAQLRRDNGKPVRRRGSFFLPSTSSFTENPVHGNFCYPSLTTEFYEPASDPNNFSQYSYKLQEQAKFSARFRYWIPETGPDYWPFGTKAALFGLNPSPALVWELMPWSWLIDWFTNLGDIIDNMSVNAADNLVADYAFVSRTYRFTEFYKMSVALAGGNVYTSTTTFDWFTQFRRAANPYGFGFTFGDLSWRQMAILAALGISRS